MSCLDNARRRAEKRVCGERHAVKNEVCAAEKKNALVLVNLYRGCSRYWARGSSRTYYCT